MCVACRWSYVFYFVYLRDTKPNDYTALDMHVYKLVCTRITVLHSVWYEVDEAAEQRVK